MRPTEARSALPAHFTAWTARIRAAVAAVERVAEEARQKERLVRQLLRRPAPDPAVIGALVIELDACRSEIDRIRHIVKTSL